MRDNNMMANTISPAPRAAPSGGETAFPLRFVL